MKKQQIDKRKLQLRFETVRPLTPARTLTPAQLADIVGGASGNCTDETCLGCHATF
jgi:hypothetical protein